VVDEKGLAEMREKKQDEEQEARKERGRSSIAEGRKERVLKKRKPAAAVATNKQQKYDGAQQRRAGMRGRNLSNFDLFLGHSEGKANVR